MIEIETLHNYFLKHMKSLRSASFVCNTNAFFESWFRVELIPVIIDMGFPSNAISTNYTYPYSREKADLVVKTGEYLIVFELKSFVNGQDSNKKYEYPKQMKRLLSLLEQPGIKQVVTFTTFCRYSTISQQNLIKKFFNPELWNIVGPSYLLPDLGKNSLQFVIANKYLIKN